MPRTHRSTERKRSGAVQSRGPGFFYGISPRGMGAGECCKPRSRIAAQHCMLRGTRDTQAAAGTHTLQRIERALPAFAGTTTEVYVTNEPYIPFDPRGSGDPGFARKNWMPACAGTNGADGGCAKRHATRDTQAVPAHGGQPRRALTRPCPPAPRSPARRARPRETSPSNAPPSADR